MTPEAYAILGVGLALGWVILTTSHRVNSRLDRLEASLSKLRERMARLEGLLEGLR